MTGIAKEWFQLVCLVPLSGLVLVGCRIAADGDRLVWEADSLAEPAVERQDTAHLDVTPGDQDIPTPVPGEMTLAGSTRPDVSRFLNVRRASSPSLSPDGSELAFSTSISGQPQLWVVSATGGWPRQLTFGESVTFHQWSPDGSWILYGTDRGGNERVGFYLIRPDGREERELLPPADNFRQFGGFSADGNTIAYAATEGDDPAFDIHLLDVESGDDRKVFDGRMGLYASEFCPDGKSVLLTEARGEDSQDVYLLDLESGVLKALLQPEIRSSFSSFAWQPDGSGFYLSSNDRQEYAGLAYHDVASGITRWLEMPNQDVDDVALSHDGRFLTWTLNDGGASRLFARDLTTGDGIEVPKLPLGIYSVDWAAAAPVAAITVSGCKVPGDIWIWNAETGTVHRATDSAAAGLDLTRMVEPRHVAFAARDGLRLHGLLYMPPGLAEGDKPPLLLNVHGGPTAQARPHFNPVHQYLLTRGIAIFDLNYRGSTGLGKNFARRNDLRQRAIEYLDMEDAVRHLHADGLVDGERAAVMGGSYGGYLTMAAMARLPEVFRGGVAIVGVSNWITALEGASPELKASDRLEYGDIDNAADRNFFEEISPIRYIDDVRAPVMVVHGANDPRDPVSESDQFVRGIRENGGEVEYLRFPDEGHGVRKLSNRIIANRRISAFLQRVLGAE